MSSRSPVVVIVVLAAGAGAFLAASGAVARWQDSAERARAEVQAAHEVTMREAVAAMALPAAYEHVDCADADVNGERCWRAVGLPSELTSPVVAALVDIGVEDVTDGCADDPHDDDVLTAPSDTSMEGSGSWGGDHLCSVHGVLRPTPTAELFVFAMVSRDLAERTARHDGSPFASTSTVAVTTSVLRP